MVCIKFPKNTHKIKMPLRVSKAWLRPLMRKGLDEAKKLIMSLAVEGNKAFEHILQDDLELVLV